MIRKTSTLPRRSFMTRLSAAIPAFGAAAGAFQSRQRRAAAQQQRQHLTVGDQLEMAVLRTQAQQLRASLIGRQGIDRDGDLGRRDRIRQAANEGIGPLGRSAFR